MKRIIEFYSENCHLCKVVEKLLEEVVKDFPEVEVVKVNVRRERELAKRYGVIAVPVLVFLKDGVEVDRIKRPESKEEIRRFVERNMA